jgi:prepilin-type N-terminal cleavage/methylation domain-containing protein
MRTLTFFKKNTTEEKGFTLIETLVAISILLIATTGPLTAAQSGLRASFLARDQISAFYLAQDVIETIKNSRDNVALDGINNDWLSGLGECAPNGTDTKVCTMETGGENFVYQSCLQDSCDPLNYASSTRQYVLETGGGTVVSKYTRTVYITEIVPDREAQIVVEVKWDSNFFAEKRVVVQENIYNWVPNFQQ